MTAIELLMRDIQVSFEASVDQTEAGYGDLKGFTSDDGLGVRGSVLGETSAATNSYLAAGIASEARTLQSRSVATILARPLRRGRQAPAK